MTAPESVTVMAYNSTTFICEAFGDDIVFTWLFQGVPVTSRWEVETSNNSDAGVTSTLTLSTISLEDSGIYTCRVSNGRPVLSPRTRQTAHAALLVLPSKLYTYCFLADDIRTLSFTCCSYSYY